MVNKVMFAHSFKLSFLRGILVVAASLLMLTGCKSSRSSVKRGSESSAVRVDLKDYTKGISDPMAKALVSEAQGWIGTRYLYGGDSKAGTDCSGLVMRVYGNVCGLKLPRSTREQVRYCTKIARNKMRPGDLVFFGSDNDDDKVSHVGLYIGEGRMIHASSSRGVMVSGFDSGYWGQRYFTGARIESAPMAFANINGGKQGRSVKEKRTAPAPEPEMAPSVPVIPRVQEVPVVPSIPDGSVGVETPDVILASSPSVPVSEPVSGASTPALSSTTPSTIDLLDLIINQKVDSIFTSSFAD